MSTPATPEPAAPTPDPNWHRLAVGQQFLRQCVEALGLGNRCVRDLVIRITIGQPVRVYAEEFVPVGKLAALVGEVPKLEPMVLFTDRLEVEPGDGGRIVVRQLARSDEDERNCCLQLLQRLESADDAERQRIKDFLYGKPE